jgi:hypothetical protein
MPIDDSTPDRQSRLEALIDEFRQAQHRRLVKRGLPPLKRPESDPVTLTPEPPFEKIN